MINSMQHNCEMKSNSPTRGHEPTIQETGDCDMGPAVEHFKMMVDNTIQERHVMEVANCAPSSFRWRSGEPSKSSPPKSASPQVFPRLLSPMPSER